MPVGRGPRKKLDPVLHQTTRLMPDVIHGLSLTAAMESVNRRQQACAMEKYQRKFIGAAGELVDDSALHARKMFFDDATNGAEVASPPAAADKLHVVRRHRERSTGDTGECETRLPRNRATPRVSFGMWKCSCTSRSVNTGRPLAARIGVMYVNGNCDRNLNVPCKCRCNVVIEETVTQ